MKKDKILDVWLPLAVFVATSVLLRSHVDRTIFSVSKDLLPTLSFSACVAVVMGLLAGAIAGIWYRSVQAAVWMGCKVLLGIVLFTMAGVAIGAIGNATAAKTAKDCGEGSIEDALKVMAGWLGGSVIGLWWGIARGNLACRRWYKA